MKRIVLMLLMIFLASCEFASEEVVSPPTLEVLEIEEVVLDVNEVTEASGVSEEVAFGSQRIAVIGERMPTNAYRRIMDAFNSELDWYRLQFQVQ
jgi:PhoPQ-activated pathogenicity-related protein